MGIKEKINVFAMYAAFWSMFCRSASHVILCYVFIRWFKLV